LHRRRMKRGHAKSGAAEIEGDALQDMPRRRMKRGPRSSASTPRPPDVPAGSPLELTATSSHLEHAPGDRYHLVLDGL
jgi:hypothetical protein